MAEVQSNDGGGGGKNKQKKQTLRVDFTPMVDMNMLLITFFMLCTTLLKPQAMNLNLPTKDEVDNQSKNKVKESTAITVLLGAGDELYYYEGMPNPDGSDYENSDFLIQTAYGIGGIRDFLISRNRVAYEEIRQLALQKKNLEITEEEFNEKTKEVQDKARTDNTAPVVIIKPSDLSTFSNMVEALDEMTISNIGSYTIVEMEEGDRHLLYTKTGNVDYLTEQQKADLASS
ncbi:MAG: biopolymer transporter ExbD [Dysgonamonadaceae bacterium]|jgi:biopolymer transport protein ExbD|nr:biopolymer transporter ExbD [Dysgonamonadaceae bacterium]